MKLRHIIPAPTIAAQANASDPSVSAWVTANAGSGKTHVLALRVIRLLLEGAPPSKILCLTYTKAAAANMSLRVFSMLSKWTQLDDSQLTVAILDIGVRVTQPRLDLARKLFARTVETPGGLKIQTIHAFCERLLQMFPFEANLPSRFTLIEDAQKVELQEEARRAVLAQAVESPQSAEGRALGVLTTVTSEDGFLKALQSAQSMRRMLRVSMAAARQHGGYRKLLCKHFGAPPDEPLSDIETQIVEGGGLAGQWGAIAAKYATGLPTDVKAGMGWALIRSLRGAAQADAYNGLFLTQKGEPKKSLASKGLGDRYPGFIAQIEAERDRVLALRDRRKALQIIEKSNALILIASAVLDHYTSNKNARALIDFDDLIDKTLALLTTFNAGWVLFKLDSGIDHILVDEAQDTSPEQWEILRRLGEEFTAGASQRSVNRTFFAVGDEKQSIYAMQGARPEKFDNMRRHFSAAMRGAEKPFTEVMLDLSFRSAPVILTSVDLIFAEPERRKGLSADNVAPVHEALKKNVPGLVEFWPAVGAVTVDPPENWRLPLDAPNPHSPPSIVAGRVAQMVSGWLQADSPERVIDNETGAPRQIRAGDIIILVRTRTKIFEPVIAALKDAGVPVAGADRLRYAAHIAVLDLMAAGRVSLLPQDDLSLACVLKSPLFGLTDTDLIELAPGRKGSLLGALEASSNPAHRIASGRLARWREWARGATPFQFYARLLGAEGARRDLVARLGLEAADAIDEFLAQSLNHEKLHAPSLASFLALLESSEDEVKRDMDAATNAVRVMTVHAAKGLEAKIVILPDTCSAPDSKTLPKIFALEGAALDPVLAWSSKKSEDVGPLAEARAAAMESALDEYRRLLYVAVTRAEERLYIMGFHGAKRPEGCWHETIEAALKPGMEEMPAPWGGGESIWRKQDAASPAPSLPLAAPAPDIAASLPDWLFNDAPPEREPPPPVRPSNILAAADADDVYAGSGGGAPRVEAFRTGRLMHALLQHLPKAQPQQRAAAAASFLARSAPGLSEQQRELLTEKALRVLNHPLLGDLFGEHSQAEAPLAGAVDLAGGGKIEISGRIDRLAILPTQILIADFKTGHSPGADHPPAKYASQLALYAAGLRSIFPDRAVRALLVYLDGPVIIELSPETLASALSDHISVTPG